MWSSIWTLLRDLPVLPQTPWLKPKNPSWPFTPQLSASLCGLLTKSQTFHCNWAHNTTHFNTLKCLTFNDTARTRECKPLPMPKFQPKVIRDSNLDLDVCRVSPKMLWIHYLVGVSHFAKFRKNWRATVWEMLINLVKSSVPQWWRKWKIDPESISTTRLEAHQKLNSSSNWLAQSSEWNNQWNWLITSSVNLLTEWQTLTGRQNENHVTSALLAELTRTM